MQTRSSAQHRKEMDASSLTRPAIKAHKLSPDSLSPEQHTRQKDYKLSPDSLSPEQHTRQKDYKLSPDSLSPEQHTRQKAYKDKRSPDSLSPEQNITQKGHKENEKTFQTYKSLYSEDSEENHILESPSSLQHRKGKGGKEIEFKSQNTESSHFSDDNEDLNNKRNLKPLSLKSKRFPRNGGGSGTEIKSETEKPSNYSNDAETCLKTKNKPTKSTSGFHLQGLIVTLALSVIPFYFIVYHWNFDNGSINDDKQHVLKYFHDQFNALESIYPSQSSHFWKRSRRALELHLNRSESNTQPAIILLTSARDAEQTLRCLSNKIAKIYSASRNMSYVFISGVNETFHDSDSAKLAIDDILTSSFQGTSSAAVMHQLEQLHPGALLILYKYCDHENAAFKNVAMVLTVLLDDLPHKPQLQLNEIEEKVRDFLAAKFSISNSERLHSEMDADKMGGVWSRISHLVLPVYPEDFLVECGSTEHGA